LGGILLYVSIAFLVGLAGLNKKGGFWRAFIIGLLLTPIVSLILVSGSGSNNPRGCEHCGNKKNEALFCGLCKKNEEGLIQEEVKS
jgi:hypothetical protein